MRIGLTLGLQAHNKKSISFDEATQSVFDHATTEGYTLPSDDVKSYLNTSIVSLKSNSIWSKLDFLYLFATDGDRDFAKINIVNPGTYDCTEVNTLTFTSLEGFAGNGTNSYLNTNWNPATGGNYSQNNASLGAYIRSFGNLSNSNVLMGTRTAGNDNTTLLSHRATNSNSPIVGINNDIGADLPDFGRNTVVGSLVESRDNSSDYDIYENGSLITTITKTSDVVLTSENLYIGAFNGGSSTATSFSTAQISIVFGGASLSATEALNIFNAIETYMDAIGKGVVS